MAAQDDDFAFVLAAVRRLLSQISGDIESATKSEYRRGDILAEHAIGALKAIERRVDAAEERFPKLQLPHSRKAAANELRFYTLLVWGTHHVLLWLRAGEEQLLDLGALYFADELALALLNRAVEVNPVENTDYMYSTSTWPLDWLLQERLGEPPPEDDEPIPVVLAFPARERSTMLMHCLFAHELSHAAVRVKGLVVQGLEPLRGSGDYQAWLEGVGQNSPLPDAMEEEAQRLTRAWLEELFCDALAFTMLGPAYLFAFAELGLSVGWSQPDKEHPSMAMRTKQLVGLAERYRWSGFLKDRLPRIWDWLEFAGQAPSILQGPAQSFAERVCRNSFERIAELVEGVLDEGHFTPEQWEKHEEHLTTLLENDILPVETGDSLPVSHPEILNASWLQALAKHGDTPAAISEAVAETDYQRFVAKALEMSTVLRTWNQEDRDDPAAA